MTMAHQVLASRVARRALLPVSRWGGLPASRVAGSPEEVLKTLPRFEKVRPEAIGLGPNPSFDMVVARRDGMQPVAVGMVSLAVDGPLAKQWQPLAACRVWHICQSGCDARFVPPFERTAGSKRTVELTGPVPGAVSAVDNLYGVVQALSWVASRRGEIDEAEAWQREMGRMIEALLN